MADSTESPKKEKTQEDVNQRMPSLREHLNYLQCLGYLLNKNCGLRAQRNRLLVAAEKVLDGFAATGLDISHQIREAALLELQAALGPGPGQ